MIAKFNRGDIITFDRTKTNHEDSLYQRKMGGTEERLLVLDVEYYYDPNTIHKPSNLPTAYKLLWLNIGQETKLSVSYADLKYRLVA